MHTRSEIEIYISKGRADTKADAAGHSVSYRRRIHSFDVIWKSDGIPADHNPHV